MIDIVSKKKLYNALRITESDSATPLGRARISVRFEKSSEIAKLFIFAVHAIKLYY